MPCGVQLLFLFKTIRMSGYIGSRHPDSVNIIYINNLQFPTFPIPGVGKTGKKVAFGRKGLYIHGHDPA